MQVDDGWPQPRLQHANSRPINLDMRFPHRARSLRFSSADIISVARAKPNADSTRPYPNSGDHAGSDAHDGVGAGNSARPNTSAMNILGPPEPPGSRKNIR